MPGKLTNKKLVYVASPVSGDVENNLKQTAEYCRNVFDAGFIPVCPHLTFIPLQVLDENNPVERKIGMDAGLEMLKVCDEVWAFGPTITEGMRKEIDVAQTLQIPVIRISRK